MVFLLGQPEYLGEAVSDHLELDDLLFVLQIVVVGRCQRILDLRCVFPLQLVLLEDLADEGRSVLEIVQVDLQLLQGLDSLARVRVDLV